MQPDELITVLERFMGWLEARNFRLPLSADDMTAAIIDYEVSTGTTFPTALRHILTAEVSDDR